MSTAEHSTDPRRQLFVESDRHQTRVAVLEDGRLTEIHLERKKTRSVVGSVFKGRVSRILPGMQAAFVDIGLLRDAFLFAGDVRAALSAIDDLSDADPQTQEFPAVSAPPQVMSAAAKGLIPPDIANTFIQSIKSMIDIEEYTDLKDRIEKIEAALNGGA